MPFVKLDTGILDSTLWVERECREIFITALLMAEPVELTEPTPTIRVDSLDPDPFVIPPGWYGVIRAAGPGIVRRALVDEIVGMAALARLASPDTGSRTTDFEGRRLVRVDGGYIALNYMKYRERDYTAAERQRRWREKHRPKAAKPPSRRNTVSVTRNITQAEAEGEGTPQKHQGVSSGPEEKEITVTALRRNTWASFATAYKARWGVDPIRDAQSNSMIMALCKKLGEDAPAVAGWYPTHPGGLYVRAQHDVMLLLRDARGLHTQWKRGHAVTGTEALASDRQAAPAAPVRARPWFLAWPTIVEKGRELGITQHEGEADPAFKARVYNAAKVTPTMVRQAEADFRGRT